MSRAAWLLGLLLWACHPGAPWSPAAPLPETSGAALELMYFVQGPDGSARFGGLAGAIEDDLAVWDLRIAGRGALAITPEAGGRFELEVPVGDASSGILHRDGIPVQSFRLRDAVLARRAAVGPPIGGAGSVPNDLLFVGQGEDTRLVLVRSGDHAISVFDRELGLETKEGLRLPERSSSHGPLGAQPWFAAPLQDGEHIAVSAFLQGRAYVIHLPTLEVEATLEPTVPLELAAPHVLPYAIDLDDSGRMVSEVSRFLPRSPQGLAVHHDHLFVAYSGFVAPRLSPTMPPVYLPGVLLRFSLADPQAAPRSLRLPFDNPQSVTFDEDLGRLIVTASGVLDSDPEVRSVTPGGVVIIDPESMAVTERFELLGFAPGSTLSKAGALWVSSLIRPEVVRLPLDGGARETFRLNPEAVDSVFRLVELPGGLIGAPSFNTDRLHVIDPWRRTLDPSPFFGPLELGPGRPIFDGLQVIARRPGRGGVDFTGPDLYALSGIASRVVPVELRKVLGP